MSRQAFTGLVQPLIASALRALRPKLSWLVRCQLMNHAKNRSTMNKTMPMITATTMPTSVLRVLPHFGQRDALELISLPHSLHLISAIIDSLKFMSESRQKSEARQNIPWPQNKAVGCNQRTSPHPRGQMVRLDTRLISGFGKKLSHGHTILGHGVLFWTPLPPSSVLPLTQLASF